MIGHKTQRTLLAGFAVAVVTALAPTSADAAQTVHITLEANGSAIEGDSTLVSLGRENTIEALEFKQRKIHVEMEQNSTTPRSRPIFKPFVWKQRIDKATPILMRALTNNEEINATFRFYRPNPTGDGTEEHFYTIEVTRGRLSAARAVSPDVGKRSTSSLPPTMEFELTPGTIRWIYEPGGVEYEVNIRD